MSTNTREIDERSEFVYAVSFDELNEAEIKRIEQWLEQNPDGAARYIRWLELQLED